MADDDLTVRIAAELRKHRPTTVNPESFVHLLACQGCDWIGGAAMTSKTDDEHRAHQAEQVRAVLGETSTEWGVRDLGGYVVPRSGVEHTNPEQTPEQYDQDLHAWAEARKSVRRGAGS